MTISGDSNKGDAEKHNEHRVCGGDPLTNLYGMNKFGGGVQAKFSS